MKEEKMPKVIGITIENKLRKEKRGINVYHHATRSAHIVSYDSSITIPFETDREDDYLHISMVSGPGNLWKDCLADLPTWADFELSAEGKVTLNHSEKRTLVKIPAGPPTWQLKITRPPGVNGTTEDTVTMGNQ
jgi:hypothetical protein